MKSYVKYYFKYKFGLSELCEEMRGNFMAAGRHFLGSGRNRNEEERGGYASMESLQSGSGSVEHERPLLVLFQKMLD